MSPNMPEAMLIFNLLFACLIVGGAGSLFVWWKKRYAKFAPLYFSMFGAGLGFYGSLFFFPVIGIVVENILADDSIFTVGLLALLVFITTVAGLIAGAYFGTIYANYVMKTVSNKV